MSHLIKIKAVCKFSYLCLWYLKELKQCHTLQNISWNASHVFLFSKTYPFFQIGRHFSQNVLGIVIYSFIFRGHFILAILAEKKKMAKSVCR